MSSATLAHASKLQGGDSQSDWCRVSTASSSASGTSSGFGKRAVEQFAAAGWNVVASVRKALDLSAHGERESVKTLLDVNDEEAGLNFAEHDLEQFGRMDALINAGYFQVGSRE